MASVLAIVSKAVFERDAPRAKLGSVLGIDRYSSAHKGLLPLREGGALFLVTVRPPKEALWLVAVLESPRLEGDGWIAAKNTVPVTDLRSIRGQLRFASGTGITAKKGALGMSLQTPRTLSEPDVALLRAALITKPAGPRHFNAHDDSGPAPCLCRRCLPFAPESVTVGGLALVRDSVTAAGRALWFWAPAALAGDRAALRRAVETRLHGVDRRRPARRRAGR